MGSVFPRDREWMPSLMFPCLIDNAGEVLLGAAVSILSRVQAADVRLPFYVCFVSVTAFANHFREA
jgi:hypothetical protein